MGIDDVVPATERDTGNTQFFQRDAFDQLVELGLIRIEPDGTATYRGLDLDLAQHPDLAVCDFCLARPVTWDIAARGFVDPVTKFKSVGGWAACEACGQAIHDGDRDTLRDRVRAATRKTLSVGWARIERLAQTEEMLAGFWAHFISIERYTPPRVV